MLYKTRKQIILFVGIISILFPPDVEAQVNIGTRFGISTLNEIQFELITPIDEKNSIYSNISYFYRGFNLNGPGCGTPWPATLYDKNNSGFSVKLGLTRNATKVKSKSQKTINIHRTFALVYRRLQGDLRINSSGCGQIWEEYDFTANDFGFYFYRDKDFAKIFSFYWGVGIVRRFSKRKRLPIVPTTETTVKSQGRIMIDLGWRVTFK